jgi:MerR family transcriptional regulator, redox-sensitive transcriptional activator SoxR
VTGLTIGEVARRAELRPSAIRYYEKLGLLPEPPRQSGQLRYDPRILERLAIVRFAKFVGFKVGEIRLLLDGSPDRPPPQRWREMAETRVGQPRYAYRRSDRGPRTLADDIAPEVP